MSVPCISRVRTSTLRTVLVLLTLDWSGVDPANGHGWYFHWWKTVPRSWSLDPATGLPNHHLRVALSGCPCKLVLLFSNALTGQGHYPDSCVLWFEVHLTHPVNFKLATLLVYFQVLSSLCSPSCLSLQSLFNL